MERSLVEILTTMAVFLALVVVLAGIVALFRGGPVHGIVLIAFGLLIGFLSVDLAPHLLTLRANRGGSSPPTEAPNMTCYDQT